MGQGQSNPRKLTVINEEATGVIKISDSVVQRLKDEMANQKAGGEGASSSGTSSSPGSAESQTSGGPGASVPPSLTPPPPPQFVPPQGYQGSAQSPPIIHQYVGEPSLSALKVRDQKEEELRQVEGYWQNRVKELRNHQMRATEIGEENFHSTIATVDKLFLKSRQAPVCQEARQAVLQCYKQNQKQSLLCTEQVNNFAKCIESARLSSLGRSG